LTRNILFVTGENTEIGKTFVASALITSLRQRGHLISARKPLQSYGPNEITDASVLAKASGEPINKVNRWSYEIPMAPPMAGIWLKQTVPTTEEVLDQLKACEHGRCFAVIEGVGGPYSPLTKDGDSISLITHIDPKAILVVIKSGLGGINSSLLCLNSLVAPNIILHFNRFDRNDPLHNMNIDFISSKLSDIQSEQSQVHLTTDIEQLGLTCEKIFPKCH
jgi:dethiobiotin synthetase